MLLFRGTGVQVSAFTWMCPHLNSPSLRFHSHVILECVALPFKTSHHTGEAHAVVNGILVLANRLILSASLVGIPARICPPQLWYCQLPLVCCQAVFSQLLDYSMQSFPPLQVPQTFSLTMSTLYALFSLRILHCCRLTEAWI